LFVEALVLQFLNDYVCLVLFFKVLEGGDVLVDDLTDEAFEGRPLEPEQSLA
jgi:hypothetical protein